MFDIPEVIRILTPKQIGNINELECILCVMKYGYKVSIPYGEDCKYDFIIDAHNKLIRVQAKHSRPIKNQEGFCFNTKSVNVTTHGVKESCYSQDDVDYFITVYDEKCYLVPVSECGKNKTLRFNYPSSGQKKYISLASNYEISQMI